MIKMNLYVKIAEKNITKQQLAKDTGIGKNTIGLYCSGDYKKIDKEHLDIFCKYFNCSVYDLITYEYERQPDDVITYRMYVESEIAKLNQRLSYLRNELNECNMIIHGQSQVNNESYNRYIADEYFIKEMTHKYKFRPIDFNNKNNILSEAGKLDFENALKKPIDLENFNSEEAIKTRKVTSDLMLKSINELKDILLEIKSTDPKDNKE